MTKAVNAETSIAYIAEVTENVTPTTPAFKLIRASGESLSVDRKVVTGSQLGVKRGEYYSAIASSQGGGGFTFDFSYGTFDDFLEAALRGTWTTNVLTDGNTAKSFTLETRFETGATDMFKRFTGSQVNTLSLDFKAAEVLTGAFGFITRGADFANAIVTGATYVATNTETVQVGANVGTITLAGFTLDCVTSATFEFMNNLRPQFGLGALAPQGIGAGKAEAKGTITGILDATTYTTLRGYADGTATGLTLESSGGTGKGLRVEVPNAILSDFKVESTSIDGDVLFTANYTGLQASAISNSVVRMTRAL